jgi:hypothetical protein
MNHPVKPKLCKCSLKSWIEIDENGKEITRHKHPRMKVSLGCYRCIFCGRTYNPTLEIGKRWNDEQIMGKL